MDCHLSLLQVNGNQLTGVLEDLIQPHKEVHEKIIDLAEFKLLMFEIDLAQIQVVYPSPIARNSLPDILTNPTSTISRRKHFLGTISVILGTFMGIYTQTQINYLAHQIDNLNTGTQKLIDITSKYTLQISTHANFISDRTLFAQLSTI